MKKLVIKYNVLPNEYNLMKLENFIEAKYCHSLARFKELLLFNYDEEFLKEECEKILVKRYGKPEEVAELVAFLVSEKANYINNAIIRIDGGQMGSC